MATKLTILLPLLLSLVATGADLNFTYNGFLPSELALDNATQITSKGLLRLTNDSAQEKGHAFYPYPISFKNNGTTASFTTTFVFGIIPEAPPSGGHGIAFVIAESRDFSTAMPSQFLGLFNSSNSTVRILAVELDTIMNKEFSDVSPNHVGIDISSLVSRASHPAGFYDDSGGKFTNLTLTSGKPMQLWIEYNGLQQLNVTLAPANRRKPKVPLLSLNYDFSPLLQDSMYVGFSSSTGTYPSSHYILGWSFKMNGDAEPLSTLPKLPRVWPKRQRKLLTIGLPVVAAALVLCGISFYLIRKYRIFAEIQEPWERAYGPHRFRYRDLYVATNGFSETHFRGEGGSGKVYQGTISSLETDIAVKVVAHNSSKDMRQFVAEIVSMGLLSHRNLVKLHGYSRRKGELLLVYDYMANGSLDKYLHNKPSVTLNWRQRFKIIKDVAAALAYLHEDFEQAVIHRDIKGSNILLDEEFNGKIGDFGLARLHDHGANSHPTSVFGTIGYIAPEYVATGIATTSTDVFAFGAFLLEVACGRRPVSGADCSDVLLKDVWNLWSNGEILRARDPKLGTNFATEELELVLQLGVLCQSGEARCRPSMKQILQILAANSLELTQFVIPKIDPTPYYPFAELYTASVSVSQLSDGR